MNITSDSYFSSILTNYCYHLKIRLSDIVAVYEDEQLIIHDVYERQPTKSAALQLVCIAKEQNVTIQLIRNHWKNQFKIEKKHIPLFIETIKKAYPHLASYLNKITA